MDLPGVLIVPVSSIAAAAARVAPRLLVVVLLVPPSLRKIAGGRGSPLVLVAWVLASMLLEGACSLAALDVHGGVASAVYLVLWAALYGQWIAWTHDWSPETDVSAESAPETVADHFNASLPVESSLSADDQTATDSTEAAVPYSSLRNRHRRGRRRTLRPSDRDALLARRDESCSSSSSSSETSADDESGLATATVFHSFASIDWAPRTLPNCDIATRSFGGPRPVLSDEVGVAAPVPASIPLPASYASLFTTGAPSRSSRASPPDDQISEPLSPSRWLLHRQVDDEVVAAQLDEVDQLNLTSVDGRIEG
ncbi:hypothetical protein AMAG_18629 [Allomyces macrogynus ATCC 38327]|uniref:Uncharacterized protein n=1 Tax=Allomyces macrogynus (strain ATCC 38327) TaxID=578462 RepID=A0A0L0SG19_ALLM3|nr:hypothetical protein AMAG_18629 [Allomyces macrogynus ATCC 38327]|eukprot:KNE61446.1 hypothetical protein AMAG_18629 [Allomyces macrogynus ATCC 38327]